MTTNQCIAMKADGTRCKRRTSTGKYCAVHAREREQQEAILSELPEGLALLVDEDNYNFIMWLVDRPEFSFVDENDVISWMVRTMLNEGSAYQTKELFRLLRDIWLQQNR